MRPRRLNEIMKYQHTILYTLFMIISITLANAQVIDSKKGNAAFLFAYYPKENLKAEFEKGYQEHLGWHKEKNDQLVWYAWYVQTGSRLGLFIDGTFGLSFQAFDNRVDRAGDGAHFAKTTAPYAELAFRKVYYLRRELSTDFPLENWDPTASMEVYQIPVIPGTENIFESIFLALNKVNSTIPKFTLYELISGDEHSGYLLMVTRNNFAYFDTDISFTSIELLIELYLPDKASAFREDLASSVKQQSSETWGYRKDLSYFPEK